MDLISVFFLCILWGIPCFLLIKEYKKLNQKERSQFWKEFKTPSCLLGILPRYLGLLLFFTSIGVSKEFIRHIGVFLIITSWFYGGLEMWGTSVKRGAFLITLASLLALMYYFFFIYS
ncbi:hypothetical protein [Sutcliffiella halmapala]|uniref:hypothetical protein n=1 Tax=Sutcliffiella halmapala TaxID=79882 RepID=UPI00099581BB|nr:hypothetical protein [Sutcliffiella halmapala]